MALTDPQIVKAANVALTEAQGTINYLKQFAFDASNEFVPAGKTVKIPVASVGDISAFNKTTNNFEKNDGSIAWEAINLDTPIKATFEVDAEDLVKMNAGAYAYTFGKACADKIQREISKKIGGLFNTTDVTKTVTLPAKKSLTLLDIASLRGDCIARPADTVLMLDTSTYAEVLALAPNGQYGIASAIQGGYFEGLFGFASVVEAVDLPSGVRGALLPKSNLVIANRGFEVADASCYSEYGSETDENTGFSITMMRHGDPATGSMYLNAVALFGMALIKKSETKLLV